LIKGLGVTLALSAITVVGGAIIGFLVCLFTMSNSKILKFLGKAYIEVIRGIPLFLQLYIFYILLSNEISSFVAIAIALIVNSGAYVAEIIRAGIQSIDKGQYEASRSLGMSKRKTMIKVILPQSIKNIIPAIGNEYVTIIKETSLGSAFFIGDLMTVQKQIGNDSYDFLGAYIVVAIFYFISTFSLSKIISRIERAYKKND
jgi:His/Glu/Gln/Arg/opine family amino acid ABC transporter permease subunit